MAAKPDKIKIPPLPKKALKQKISGHINEDDYPVEFIFNETENDDFQRGNKP